MYYVVKRGMYLTIDYLWTDDFNRRGIWDYDTATYIARTINGTVQP